MRDYIIDLTYGIGEMWALLIALGIALSAAMVIINLCKNPYSKQNRIMLSNCTYLARKMRETVNLNNLTIPSDYEAAFNRFKCKSSNAYPSEVIDFIPKVKRIICLKLFAFIALAFLFAGVLYSDNYSAALAYAAITSAAMIIATAIIENSNATDLKGAKRMFTKWLASLDNFFGNDYISGVGNPPSIKPLSFNTHQNRAPFAPMATDVKIDRTVEQLKYLASHGINDSTAKEIVSLLSDPSLGKRTVEQQRKINDALGQILQLIADKKEEKILS